MATLSQTENTLGSVIVSDAEFSDEILAFDGADTWVEGTILAKKEVTVPTTGTADGGNTGDGTVTAVAAADGPTVPRVGTYTLTATAAATNGGTFQLTGPSGAILASDLIMTAGAGASTAFEAAGLAFTITDGAADFVVGDSFTIAVTADGDLKPFVSTGVGGLQVPYGVLTYEQTVTGSGDVSGRVMIAGKVNKDKLIIDVDGDGSNVDATVVKQLRDVSIVAVAVDEQLIFDN